MKLTLTIHRQNGTTRDVTTSLASIVQWERQYGRRAGDLAAGFSAEDLGFLAWASEKRSDPPTALGFDEWSETVAAIEVKESEDSHPTGAAPTVGN